MADAFDKLRVIRGGKAISISSFVCFPDYRIPEGLWRLGLIDSLAIQSPLHPPRLHLLDGVNRWNRHQGSSGVCRSLDHASYLFGSDEGPSRIVHDNDAGVLFLDHLKSSVDRILALGASGHDAPDLRQVVSRDKPEHVGGQARLQNEDDLMNGIAVFESAKRMYKQWYAAQLDHLLGAIRMHSRPDSGGGNYGDIELALGHGEADV
jgi:hypothetical protein